MRIDERTGMDWRDRAACLGEDPDLFFPIGDSGPSVSQVQQAKKVCRRCPVIQPCLEWALASGDEGVLGGLDDRERRRLRALSRPVKSRPKPMETGDPHPTVTLANFPERRQVS
jgi:WhiB family transcriptional regulator, redox-sensing transcriptional regulator